MPRFPAAVVTAILLSTSAIAQDAGAPATNGQPSPAPTPFAGNGTLAPTPTPTPAPTATPFVKYEPPQVSLTGDKIPNSRGVSLAASKGGYTQTMNPGNKKAAPAYPYQIKGTIHSFSLPPHGYVAQFFFIVKVENEKPLIYAYSESVLDKNYVDVLTYAPGQVAPGGFFALPDVIYKFNDPANKKNSTTARVEDVTPVTVTGKGPIPVGGWILRVIADDQIVYVGASQDNFANMAQDNPYYFNKVVEIYKEKSGNRF